MDQIIEGAGGASEQAPVAVITAAGDDAMSVTQAARALAQARHKDSQQAGEQRDDAQRPQEESTVETGDAAPPEAEATGETQEADPAARPPIEPPRSWSKEARERWARLDPETQQYLLDRDSTDSAAVRKAQNEAAAERKAIEAERAGVDQARHQYESALPQLLYALQQQQAGEFSDIQSIQDVERLARDDWPRYLQWDLSQRKVAHAHQLLLEANQRHQGEQQQRFAVFAKRQDDLFLEKVPELADASKMADLQKSAVETLKAIGFDTTELAPAWDGQKDLSLRDHRVQLLIRDATLWREAQAKAKAAATKPVPPVQRPGTSQPRGAAQEQQIQNLNKQLENASGVNALRTAAKLVATRRAAAR